MEQAKIICKENVEENYEKYKNVGNEIYQEYEKLNKQMCLKLNGSHLDPFAKILMEREKIVLKGQNELMETVRQSLEEQLQQSLHDLWHSNNVSEALISLEMCKEVFQSYKGYKWDMEAKTPWELTRPIRMRYKEHRIRYLQAQLNLQNKELEEVVKENESLRQRLLHVKQSRTFFLENIQNFRKKIEFVKPKIMELQLKLLAENDEK